MNYIVPDVRKFQRSVDACLEHAKGLLEDAEWSTRRSSTGLALALLAQEECAKGFVLTLIRDGVLPWTAEIRRSLSSHESKHLMVPVMEWLSIVNETRFNEFLTRTQQGESIRREHIRHLPPEVATAMNIYRHETIERMGGRYAERHEDWKGSARRIANGQRDRKKQAALYVGIGEEGDLVIQATTDEAFQEELARAKRLMEVAERINRKCIFADSEFELFSEILGDMFQDLADPQVAAASEEEVPSGIPGLRFVRRMIRIAPVVETEDREEARVPSRIYGDQD